MFRFVLKTRESHCTGCVRGESLSGPGIRLAQRLLASGRVSHIVVLERTWDAVDRTRLLLDALADDRITVRHIAAKPLLTRALGPRHVA